MTDTNTYFFVDHQSGSLVCVTNPDDYEFFFDTRWDEIGELEYQFLFSIGFHNVNWNVLTSPQRSVLQVYNYE